MNRISRHERKVKAIAEVLAMAARGFPDTAPSWPKPARVPRFAQSDAEAFCQALEAYTASVRGPR